MGNFYEYFKNYWELCDDNEYVKKVGDINKRIGESLSQEEKESILKYHKDRCIIIRDKKINNILNNF